MAVSIDIQSSFVHGEWPPAGYFSKQTRGAEKRYPATELEALIVENIRHFSYYVYGREFEVFTDHRPYAHCCRVTG